jgi:hypothetical protein
MYELDEVITDLEDIIIRLDRVHFPQRLMELRLQLAINRDKQYITRRKHEDFIHQQRSRS